MCWTKKTLCCFLCHNVIQIYRLLPHADLRPIIVEMKAQKEKEDKNK